MNLAAILAEHARTRGRHPALVEGERMLDYAAFDAAVRRAAAHLRALGIGPGAIVGVCLRDRIEHLVAVYAVAFAGGVVLPLDWRWTRAEVERVASFFEAALLLAEPDAAFDGVRVQPVDAGWDRAVAASEPLARCAPGGDAPAILSLSSGTTGRPKGPMLSHDQFVARFVFQQKTLGMSGDDVYLSATPLYFGAGRGLAMGCLHAGGTVALFPPPYEPAALVEAAANTGATVLLLVPTLLRRLLERAGEAANEAANEATGGASAEAAGGAKADAAGATSAAHLFPGLRMLVSTGATLHAAERRAVMQRLAPRFVNYYGSTEGGGISVLLPEHGDEADGSVGQPIFGTEVQVVDEAHRPLAAGQVGRIRYRSAGTADGFHRDPEASRHAFHDGWYYPGDLGYVDARGFLFLTGRARDLIIRGGVNIYPDEIEAVLLAHPAVREAAVVGVPSPELGEEVAAFVVLDAQRGAGLAEDALIAHCRDTLARYKVPSRIVLLDALPRSSAGKIVKTGLAERLSPKQP